MGYGVTQDGFSYPLPDTNLSDIDLAIKYCMEQLGYYTTRKPLCIVERVAAANYANGWSVVTFDSEVVDDPAAQMYDTTVSTSAVTIQRAGTYRVTALAGFAGNATGDRGVGFSRSVDSGATWTPQSVQLVPAGAGTIPKRVAITDVLLLGSQDRIRLDAYQASGAALGHPGIKEYRPRLIVECIKTTSL